MRKAPEPPPQPSAKEILRARARAYAALPLRPASSGPALEVVEFALADERYAVETARIVEIHPLDHLTPLPCTPPFVRGIMNVRGRITAIIDLKRFFELPEQGLADLHRVIVVRHQNIELGLLADQVIGTRSIPLAELQPGLPTLTGIRAEYLAGVGPDRLVVLAVTRILSDPKLLVNDHATP